MYDFLMTENTTVGTKTRRSFRKEFISKRQEGTLEGETNILYLVVVTKSHTFENLLEFYT